MNKFIKISSVSEYDDKVAELLSLVNNHAYMPSVVNLAVKELGKTKTLNYSIKTKKDFKTLISKAISSAYGKTKTCDRFFGTLDYTVMINDRGKQEIYFSLVFTATKVKTNKFFEELNYVIAQVTIDISAKEIDKITEKIC